MRIVCLVFHLFGNNIELSFNNRKKVNIIFGEGVTTNPSLEPGAST